MITDSHCHLYWDSFQDDLTETLQRAQERGVERMVVVGTNVETSNQAKGLAGQHKNIFATAGIHPHDAEGTGEAERAVIRDLARDPECVAIGETGLDWFRNGGKPDEESRKNLFDQDSKAIDEKIKRAAGK